MDPFKKLALLTLLGSLSAGANAGSVNLCSTVDAVIKLAERSGADSADIVGKALMSSPIEARDLKSTSITGVIGYRRDECYFDADVEVVVGVGERDGDDLLGAIELKGKILNLSYERPRRGHYVPTGVCLRIEEIGEITIDRLTDQSEQAYRRELSETIIGARICYEA